MQKGWEFFALFSSRSYAELCLPYLGLCLLASIIGIISKGAQGEWANKGQECAFSIPDVRMEVKYWWANFKWEWRVIVRGLKLREILLQAAQFFQRDLGFEDWKALQRRRGQCWMNSRHRSWELCEGFWWADSNWRFGKERRKKRWCKYNNSYSCISKTENHPEMWKNIE